MATPTYVTSAESKIQVTLAGVTFPAYIRSWKTFSGGDPVAATSQMLPGGMQPAVALPGPVKRSDVTVELPYSWDIHGLVAAIDGAVNNRMTASYTPTDADGNVNSNQPVTRSGIFKQPQYPKWDGESGESVLLGLVMTCDT